MAIPRADLSRFAVEAVCGGKGKEEIVIDLTDAGVTQQVAQRIVDEIGRIHEELRPEGADGLEEKVLQTWLRQGTSFEYVPSMPAASPPNRPDTDPGARGSDHAIASALVVIFRFFAILSALIHLVLLLVPIGVAAKAGTPVLGALLLAPLIQGILIVSGFLAIAEVLRLGIAIERNTRQRRF